MPETMTGIKPFLSADFLAQENLDRADETVFEVFARMLGLPVEVVPEPIPTLPEGLERTAIVGYSGSMRGCCEIRLNLAATEAVASAMLGGIPVEDDDSLDDAIGELCNMIGGGWKDRVPALSSLCSLAPPTIISGHAYRVQMSRPSIRMNRCYHFNGHYLMLTLRREETA